MKYICIQDGRAWSDGRKRLLISTHNRRCTCLAFLASHSTKHPAYPRSHQTDIKEHSLQKPSHMHRTIWEGTGKAWWWCLCVCVRVSVCVRVCLCVCVGGSEQPNSSCIQKYHSKQINSSCCLSHLARPWKRPGRNTRNSQAAAKN